MGGLKMTSKYNNDVYFYVRIKMIISFTFVSIEDLDIEYVVSYLNFIQTNEIYINEL